MSDQNRDPISFYDVDLEALPRATPRAMPRSTLSDTALSSFRMVQDDWPGQSEQEAQNDYGPLIEMLREETGRPISDYVFVGGRSGGVNERRVFEDLAAVRARNPDFMKDTPSTPEEFRASVVQRVKQRRGVDQTVIDRADGAAGTAAWIGGTLGGAVADPINLMTMPFGGGGATIGRRILSQALIGSGVEAVEQPMIAREREVRGEELTAGEAALNIGTAGVGAGALQGGGEMAVRGVQRLSGPVSDLIEQFRTRIGMERATPEERAAVFEVEREAEIVATSPFQPGRDTARHTARMRAAERMLADPASAPVVEPPIANRDVYFQKLRGAESGGNDAARPRDPKTGRLLSSATGRFQFIDSTWISYYQRRFGEGETRAQMLAKRTDPAIQEQLVRDLTDDNARALAQVGARETMGNLYLMHFLGQGGGRAVLRAAPDTPIERVVGMGVVKANPWLRGKTVADTIDWAHAKMGETPVTAPTLRRDQFDSEAEWAAAQRDVDAQEAALARAEAEFADLVDAAEQRWTGIDPRAEPAQIDALPADAETVQLFRPNVDGARAFETEDAARSAAPEAQIEVVEVPRSIVDEIAPQAQGAAPPGAREIDAEAVQAWRAPSQSAGDAQPAMGASRPDANAYVIGRGMVAGRGQPGYSIERSDDGSVATVVLRGDDGTAKAGLMVPVTAQAAREFGDAVSYVGPSVANRGAEARMRNLAREAGLPVDGVRTPIAMDAPAMTSAGREPLAGFADPFEGTGPRTLTESLEHDVRMIAREAPDTPVRLSDEGETMRLVDVLEELDSDDAALSAARNCMVPVRGGGGAPMPVPVG